MPAPIRPRLRVAAAAAITSVAMLGLSACSEDAAEGNGAENAEPTSIQVTVEGDSIAPTGERVQVEVGEPVTIEVSSDREGSFHVHSTPEQEITFSEGTSEHEVVLDRPGVVEVETHDPDLVVLQLEAR